MHRTVLSGLCLAATLLTACGDSNGPGGGDYFLRFQANGSKVEYTVQASLLATFGESGSQRTMVATGYDGQSEFSVSVFDGVAIGTKTYTGYDIDVGVGAFVGVVFTYQDGGGTLYGPGNGTTIDESVTITDLTSTGVRGTFHGTMKADGHPDVAITNGEFYVRRAN